MKESLKIRDHNNIIIIVLKLEYYSRETLRQKLKIFNCTIKQRHKVSIILKQTSIMHNRIANVDDALIDTNGLTT